MFRSAFNIGDQSKNGHFCLGPGLPLPALPSAEGSEGGPPAMGVGAKQKNSPGDLGPPRRSGHLYLL